MPFQGVLPLASHQQYSEHFQKPLEGQPQRDPHTFSACESLDSLSDIAALEHIKILYKDVSPPSQVFVGSLVELAHKFRVGGGWKMLSSAGRSERHDEWDIC